MNRETKNFLSTEVENNKVYYARVASTEGEKVKIYRYALMQECAIFERKIAEEKHPVKKAVLRHQLAQFIMNHSPEFSGDKTQLLTYAARCNFEARYVVENVVITAENMVKYTRRAIRQIEQEYKTQISPRNTQQPKRNGVIYSTDSKQHRENRLPADVKRRLDDLRAKHKHYSALHNQYQQICPRHICDQIIELAEIFHHNGYLG